MCGIMEVKTKTVIAGCTIIDPNYCLTAAHSVINRTLSDLALICGDQDYSIGNDSPYTKIYRFLAFIKHPFFDSVSNLNDLAIMRIYGQITFNAGVSAVCLPFRWLHRRKTKKKSSKSNSHVTIIYANCQLCDSRLSQSAFVYSQVDAVGWGRTSFGGIASTSLQKAALTVIPNTECNRSYPYQISGAQMCTFTKSKDTCDVSICFCFIFL